MKKIQSLSGRELRWVQPKAFQCSYELRDGDEVVATLRSSRKFSSTVDFESADGRWTFRRVGFCVSRTLVFGDDPERPLATYHPSVWHGGGTLDIHGAEALRAKANFSMSRLEFRDGDQPIVRCDRFRGLFHRSSTTTIAPRVAQRPELPWLVGLAWYQAIKMQDDAGAAAAAAAAG